jgi:predicted ester cyclase
MHPAPDSIVTYYEALNCADADKFNAAVHPEFVASYGGRSYGIPVFWSMVEQNRIGFPDFHRAMRRCVVDHERTAVELVCSGTHRGEWLSHAGTGRSIHVVAMEIIEESEGRVRTVTGVFDTLTMLIQLALYPAVAPAATEQ